MLTGRKKQGFFYVGPQRYIFGFKISLNFLRSL